MRFQFTHSTNTVVLDTPPRPVGALDLKALLEAGRRLAASLPLTVEAQTLHPMARLASVNVARTQVRLCLAALGGADASQLTELRERLSQAVRAINRAPNEATARALFDSSQVQDALWAWSGAEATIFVRNLTRNAPVDADRLSDLTGDAVML